MIARNGMEVHPLRQSSIRLGNETAFELNALHNRSWFILDLALPGRAFIPADCDTALVTADGQWFGTYSRRIKKG